MHSQLKPAAAISTPVSPLENVRHAKPVLIKAMLPFRELIESGRLEPEKLRLRGAQLCMNSYQWLFHSSRYSVKPSDTAQKFNLLPATTLSSSEVRNHLRPLTSDDMDLWTDTCKAPPPSGKNTQLFKKIEGAMIILALDDT